MKALLPFVLLAVGCSSPTPAPEAPAEPQVAETEELSACQVCIDQGRTWQPESEACTPDCAIADISCFTDVCPGACEDDCGFCFSQEDCEAAECQWNRSGESMWCGE